MIALERLQSVTRHQGWLLAGLFLVVLPHFTRLPLALTAFCLLTFGWRVLSDLKLAGLPPRWLRLGLIAVGVGLVLGMFHTLLGREAGAALLVIMLCLKLLEMNTRRDTVVTIFLGYFVVIAGFLFDQSLVIGLYMFAVVIALTAALIALHGEESSRPPPSRPGRLALVLLAQALPIALLMFVLFPRIPGPLWGLPEDAYAQTGLSDTMSPGLISELTVDDSVAFRVEFDRAPPDDRQLYWRGPVFWLYDGRAWSSPGGVIPTEPDARFEPLGRAVEYSVLLEPHDRRWLFGLDLVSEPPPGAGIAGAHQVLADQPVKRLQRYTARSTLDYRLGAGTEPNPRRYEQVPSDSAVQARDLARQWRNAAPDDAAIVQRGLDFFREQPFVYTLTAPLLLDDPIDDFLFETRRGYCEHFASSFAILMRLAGVPARIVTGYQGAEANPLGDYWLVRQADAHAWVEVWLGERGWVRVDPTAVIPPERVEVPDALDRNRLRAGGEADGERGWLGDLAAQFRYGWDNLNHTWKQWVVGYDRENQRSLLDALGLEGRNWGHLIGAFAVTLTAAAIVVTGVVLRRRRAPRDPVRRLYDRFCAKLAGRGLARDPAEAPLQYAERIAGRRPDLAFAVWRITRLYNTLRYAPAQRPGQHEALAQAVRDFRP